MKGYKYNHIVIEATGIAEPRSIRDQFQDAEAAGMPLMEEVELSTLVTVVDSAAFLDAYAETASIAQRPPSPTCAAPPGRAQGTLSSTS